MSDERFGFPRTELRSRAARGAITNGLFLLVIEALGLIQAVVVARLLDSDQVGLYGIVSVTVMTLLALKQVGIDEGYVQQESSDQELAFQRAFSLDLAISVAFTLVIAALSPLIGLLYGDQSLTPLMLALSLLPVLFALQAPVWIYLRRMDFIRQRLLQGVVPAVTLITTVALLLLGLGTWGLVIGALAGNAAAALLAVGLSPYRLQIAFERETTRHYLRFSAPIALAAVCGLIIRQGQFFAFDLKLGLAGAGYLTLAITVTRYADRADQMITQTIYPAICAVREAPDRLVEVFEKSNRLTAMWALPFGAVLALFAPGLVRWVLGSKWDPAILLIQLVGVSTAIYQIGFNWTAFHRAVGRTRPQTVYAISGLLVFLAVPLPLLFVYGSAGFAWGLFAVNIVAGALRWFYMRELLPGARIARLIVRSFLPPVLACTPVLIWRATDADQNSLPIFVGQLVLYLCSYVLITILYERDLLTESIGYIRRRSATISADTELI